MQKYKICKECKKNPVPKLQGNPVYCSSGCREKGLRRYNREYFAKKYRDNPEYRKYLIEYQKKYRKDPENRKKVAIARMVNAMKKGFHPLAFCKYSYGSRLSLEEVLIFLKQCGGSATCKDVMNRGGYNALAVGYQMGILTRTDDYIVSINQDNGWMLPAIMMGDQT